MLCNWILEVYISKPIQSYLANFNITDPEARIEELYRSIKLLHGKGRI